MEDTPIHRVFVIWTNPLFYEFIRLLLRHPAIEVMGTGSDSATSQEPIERLRPETVIWERPDEQQPSGAELMPVLEKASSVLCFSLASNEVRIYQRRCRSVASAEDLLRLVLGQACGEPARSEAT